MDKISFKGLHGQFDVATWQADSSIVFDDSVEYNTTLHGAPVKITGERTVGLCAAGDAVFGTLIRTERDGACLIGHSGVHAFRVAQDAEIGTGTFTAGTGIVAGADNTVVGGGGRGTVTGIETEYGTKYLYVNLTVNQPAPEPVP